MLYCAKNKNQTKTLLHSSFPIKMELDQMDASVVEGVSKIKLSNK